MKIALLATDNREMSKRYDLPQPYFGTAPEALLQGFDMLEGIEVHVVSCLRQPVNAPEKIGKNLWYHSLQVPKIGWMSTGYQGCIRAVRTKLAEISPDLVHAQGTERECAISGVFSGFPNLLTLHGNMRLIAKVNSARPFSYMWLNAHLERFTLPLTGGVVCITHYTQDAVKDLVHRTWVVPNAVDARFFEVCPQPQPIPQIFVVGLICHRKNQNLLIRALDSVAARHDFRLVFLGHASKPDAYTNEFHTLLKTRPWCEWRGFADRDVLRAEMATAAGLVLPSLEDNCPMVVLEAMAAGVPVIAANVGGVPDLVTDGLNGLLCDPTSEESLASTVERLLCKPDATRSLAATALRMANERFHPRHIAERHLEIYRQMLNHG